MEQNIQERLARLRGEMEREQVDAVLVVSEDFHGSEYVGEHFRARAYLSGFTGSAGTLVVERERAALWTDGRYFLQAEEQLRGTGIDLMRIREPGVPTVEDYLAKALPGGAALAFDGRTVSLKLERKLRKTLGEGVRFVDLDLPGRVWEDRPALSAGPVEELAVRYAGKGREEKLTDLRRRLEEKGADLLVLTSLDDIAWLLNLRGEDVAYNPVFLSYLVVERTGARLYVSEGAVPSELAEDLAEEGTVLRPYGAFYQELPELSRGKKVWIDPAAVNASVWKGVETAAARIEEENPTLLPKALKNETELANLREAHRKDGVAVTRFLYWLKTHVGKERITELSAAEKLEEFRQQGSDYRGQSFAPIAGYAQHGAVIHYSADEQSDLAVEAASFFLLDTGGQYLEGTTDITRTVALGPLTAQQKQDYTAVLKGNLSLAAAVFKEGCRGENLDVVARTPLWELGLDYNHGTGHGVGYFLNVHEGPASIHLRVGEHPTDSELLREGMVLSDEPGIYREGEYGVRLENLMTVQKGQRTAFGQFLRFETLTMVPFDLEAVDPSALTEREKKLLNDYHRKVYQTIAPALSEEEREWLAGATREV